MKKEKKCFAQALLSTVPFARRLRKRIRLIGSAATMHVQRITMKMLQPAIR